MILTEKLNDISTWILTDLKKSADELSRYKKIVTNLEQEFQEGLKVGAKMLAECNDDEKAILVMQRPDVVELLESVEIIEEVVEEIPIEEVVDEIV